MGYGILRGQKIKLDGIKGMEIHILRERKSRSNPDIDTNKSKDNYAIITLEDKLNAKVARRTEELPGQRTKTGKLRKIQNNAVRMYDFIITGTHEDITQIDYKNYFLEAVEFMKRKFGEKNVMYAQVHLDERTPHLHLGLVPEYKGKLAAYQLFTPESMRKLQDEFYEQVSKQYGLERGELVDDESEDKPKRKHKTAVELKSETLAEVNREKENLARVKSDVADAECRRVEMLRELEKLQKILEELKIEVDKKKKEYEENKLLADSQEQKYCDLFYNLRQAENTIKLADFKKGEYNVTSFLLSGTEKELKEKSKELEKIKIETNKIIQNVEEKLLQPIINMSIASDSKNAVALVNSTKNFIKQAINMLPNLQKYSDDIKNENNKKIILDRLKESENLSINWDLLSEYEKSEINYKQSGRDL